MIVIRQKVFSAQRVLENVVNRLEKDGIRDFEVSTMIPRDCISITTDLSDLTIYLPEDLEYSQYGIDACIRQMLPYARTNITSDRNIYTMKVHGRLSESQLVKLIKYIIKDSEFCVILNR